MVSLLLISSTPSTDFYYKLIQGLVDWYENEHAPARLAVPGFSSAIRLKATDNKAPSWLDIYDTATPEVLQGDGYKSLAAKGSANEKSIISRIATVNRSIYRRLDTVNNPDVDVAATPAKFMFVVGVQPSPEKKEEVNKWYEDEHLALIAKVPGFVRVRRYELVSGIQHAGKADVNSESPPVMFPYLILSEWQTNTYAAEPAFKEMKSTPWCAEVLGGLVNSEFRPFVIHYNASPK